MSTQVQTSLAKILVFLERLDQHNIAHRIQQVRDAIMVCVDVPGQRWEIEFFEDGHVEVERFVSTGSIEGEDVLNELITKYGD